VHFVGLFLSSQFSKDNFCLR